MKHKMPASILMGVLLSLLLSIPALADTDASPEGCYALASGDTDTNDSGGKEICLKSENVQEAADGVKTGKFTITIRDGNKVVKTYNMTSSRTDGSGSHSDYLFAEKAATLKEVGNADDYARERRGPIPNVIFYILATLKGDDPMKPGEKAGSVTIDGTKHSLFKK